MAKPHFGQNELKYVTECILTEWISSAGQYVNTFEEQFSQYCDTKYGISTSSGTTALHLALLAANIGPGDEVIVPSLTFIATANAVTYTGATPIFVDSDPEIWTIDPNKIEEVITENTKAIIPVHLYGHPADMDLILKIAHKYGLVVIEDAAEAHGAEYKGKKVGGIGDIGIFSFYGNKIITTGEGGMVVTNNPLYEEKIRILRDHGMSKEKRYWHTVLGYNYRMTNIQAAIGVAQLEKIDEIINKKRDIAHNYNELLGDVEGIIICPEEKDWAKNVYWLYTVLLENNNAKIDRDLLMYNLSKQNIETRPVFPPIHTQPIYSKNQMLPVCESVSCRGFSLPSHPELKYDDIETIIQTLRQEIN